MKIPSHRAPYRSFMTRWIGAGTFVVACAALSGHRLRHACRGLTGALHQRRATCRLLDDTQVDLKPPTGYLSGCEK